MRVRSMIVPAALVGAAVAIAPAAPAAGAPLAVQDDRLTSGPLEDTPNRLALLARTRTKVTRIDVLWSLVAPRRPQRPVNPNDPAYDWRRLDGIVRGLDRRNIVPIVVVYSAPPWAAGGRAIPPNTEVNPHAPAPAQFAAFMRALATRYSGAFRPAGQRERLPQVRHFELWNEPNLRSFLSPQFQAGRPVGVQRYVEMVRRAYPAIKRANRRAIVIAGAGGPRSSTSTTGMGALQFARMVARSTAPFDAYSQHVYPAAAPRQGTRAFPAWRTLPQLYQALDAVPRRRGMPVYITEAGYTTAATPFREVRVTPRQQATYLRQIMALPVVRNPRVRVVMWFNLQDNVNWPGGLLNLNGRPKPSHAAFIPIARASRLHADLRPPGITLSRQQLLINQRISQAAVRRLNAIQQRLDRRLTRDDLRPRGIGPAAFGPSVQLSVPPGGPGAIPPPRDRRPVQPAAPPRRPGAAAGIRLTAGQLLINQRISQAAVRRANGLHGRVDRGLTGGDLRPGAIGQAQLPQGVRVASTTDVAQPPAPTVTRVAAPGARSGRVALSANQLRINQRISQAAVRRANALAEKLAEGLVTGDFQRGSISSVSLDPALRGGS